VRKSARPIRWVSTRRASKMRLIKVEVPARGNFICIVAFPRNRSLYNNRNKVPCLACLHTSWTRCPSAGTAASSSETGHHVGGSQRGSVQRRSPELDAWQRPTAVANFFTLRHNIRVVQDCMTSIQSQPAQPNPKPLESHASGRLQLLKGLRLLVQRVALLHAAARRNKGTSTMRNTEEDRSRGFSTVLVPEGGGVHEDDGDI